MANRKNNKLERFIEVKNNIDNTNHLIMRLNEYSELPGNRGDINIKISDTNNTLNIDDPTDLIKLLKDRMDNLKLELIEIYRSMDIENEIDLYFEY